MAFWISISLVICIVIPLLKSQNTVSKTTLKYEAQLSEMNARMQALERTINTFIPEIMNNLQNGQDKIEKLQSEFTAQFNCEKNKSSVYTIHYEIKNWIDADLSCKTGGGHLVSFESADEYNHVFELIQSKCSVWGGFWTSARDLGSDIWIWRNSGEMVLRDLWWTLQPDGDGDCGHMHQHNTNYPLNDFSCDRKMCYICEIT